MTNKYCSACERNYDVFNALCPNCVEVERMIRNEKITDLQVALQELDNYDGSEDLWSVLITDRNRLKQKLDHVRREAAGYADCGNADMCKVGNVILEICGENSEDEPKRLRKALRKILTSKTLTEAKDAARAEIELHCEDNRAEKRQ